MNTSIFINSYWESVFYSLFKSHPGVVYSPALSSSLIDIDHCDASLLVQPFGTWFPHEEIDILDVCVRRHISDNRGDKLAFVQYYSINSCRSISFIELDILVQSWVQRFSVLSPSSFVLIVGSHGIDIAASMLALASLNIPFSVCFNNIGSSEFARRVQILSPQSILLIDSPGFDPIHPLLSFSSEKIIYKSDFSDSITHYLFNSDYASSFFSSSSRISSLVPPLFALFTSGSTGIPKAVFHSKIPYLLYSYQTFKYFWDITCDDVFLCASDAGWINGHTYAVFGSLLHGCTSVLVSKPDLVLASTFFPELISNLGLSCVYLPVSIIRFLRTLYPSGLSLPSHLKAAGSMGEPLAPIVRSWFSSSFLGKEDGPVINTYFQTETSGILCSSRSSDTTYTSIHNGIGTLPPFIGLSSINNFDTSELVITTPWPGSPQYLLGSPNSILKYIAPFGYFRLFDSGSVTGNTLVVGGRTDDILIIQGKNVSSTHLESFILGLDISVSEVVIFVNYDASGASFLLAAITGFDESSAPPDGLFKYLRKSIVTSISSQFVLKALYSVNTLPKTNSGKIMRSLIRKTIAEHNDVIPPSFTVQYNENQYSYFQLI